MPNSIYLRYIQTYFGANCACICLYLHIHTQFVPKKKYHKSFRLQDLTLNLQILRVLSSKSINLRVLSLNPHIILCSIDMQSSLEYISTIYINYILWDPCVIYYNITENTDHFNPNIWKQLYFGPKIAYFNQIQLLTYIMPYILSTFIIITQGSLVIQLTLPCRLHPIRKML